MLIIGRIHGKAFHLRPVTLSWLTYLVYALGRRGESHSPKPWAARHLSPGLGSCHAFTLSMVTFAVRRSSTSFRLLTSVVRVVVRIAVASRSWHEVPFETWSFPRMMLTTEWWKGK